MNSFAAYFQYNLFGLLYLTAGIFDITVGSIVLLKDTKNPLNRSFFFVTVAAFIWSISIGMLNLTASTENAKLWLSTQYFFGVPFISPMVYLFSSLWVKKKNLKLTYVAFFFAFCAMIAYSFFPDKTWIIKERWWGRYPTYLMTPYGKFWITFLLTYFFTFAFLAFHNFYKGWINSTNPREKAQFRNILVAFLIGYTGAIDFVAAFDYDVLPIGFTTLSTMMFVVAYTMVKHEFLDVNLIFKKGFLLILIYSGLITIALPASVPLAKKISKESIGGVLGIGLGIGVILSLGPFIYAYLARRNFWLKGHLTTGLAHELKSPINAIYGATEILQSHISSDSWDRQKISDYIGMIQKNSERLDYFVKDLLHIAKIQENNVVLNLSHFRIKPLIETNIQNYLIPLTTKNIQIITQIDDIELWADEEKISQIFSNLLSNAIKFSEKDGEITVIVAKTEETIFCSVQDRGTGISKADINFIFDRFFQGRKVSKGSGIGLAIAKAWVEAHSGKIWVESEGEGKGTRVKLILPTQ